MPMGFEDILEFEKLNDVQVNVFGYDNGQLFPLKVSSYESEFVMDLLLLYYGDYHHYVLITDLVKSFDTYDVLNFVIVIKSVGSAFGYIETASKVTTCT